MNPERWHQVEQIYNSVLERNPEERNAFLENACAGGNRQERKKQTGCCSISKPKG